MFTCPVTIAGLAARVLCYLQARFAIICSIEFDDPLDYRTDPEHAEVCSPRLSLIAEAKRSLRAIQRAFS